MQASRLVTAAATEFDFMLFGTSWLSSWRRGKLQKALIGHIKGTAPEKVSPSQKGTEDSKPSYAIKH
jgi:hypothetical protein